MSAITFHRKLCVKWVFNFKLFLFIYFIFCIGLQISSCLLWSAGWNKSSLVKLWLLNE
uniref:Uncharacterized protein n=1 Tax=Anguilla anguilla TaxID=7936 RepID=A0A0E9V7A8_ANGAN